MKIIATNRKARHNYDIIETYEAGIALRGDEVKSLRVHACSIDDAFAMVEKMQVYLYNMHIPEYFKSSYFRSEPKRKRKLLLNKKEIKRLLGSSSQKGYTLTALKAYFNDRGYAKIELGLGKGRQLYDKRKKLKDNIVNEETRRVLKKYRIKG